MLAITRHSSQLHSIEQDLKIVNLKKGCEDNQSFAEIVRVLRQLGEMLCAGQPS